MSLRSRRPLPIDAQDFIAAADERPEPAASKTKRAGEGSKHFEPKSDPNRAQPWNAPGVRADVHKVFNLRLPEPYKLKLDHIRAKTRISAHQFILDAVLPAIDAEIERIGDE